jgi:signal transduction histidine kinase
MLVKTFLKFLDFFIPHELIEAWGYGEKQKARMIVVSGLFGLVVPFVLLHESSGFPKKFMLLFYCIWALSLYSIFAFRIFRPSLKVVGSICSLCLSLILIGFVVKHKIFFSATFGWFTSSVIVATFMVGWRWGLLNFSLLAGAIIYSHHEFSGTEVMIPEFWDETSWLANFKSDQILSLTFNTMMIFIFLFTKNKSEEEVLHSQELIRKQQESLFKEARMAELGKVAGGIAHEINNPITIIKANAQRVEKRLNTGDFDVTKLTYQIGKIVDTCDRISKIVEGLRNYSRDGSQDPIEDVPLKPLFEDIKEIFKESFKQNEIDVEVIIGTDDLAVNGRHSQIYQVLVNLINNAVDAIKNQSDKRITVSCKRSFPDKVLIEVIDSGKGIAKEVEEKVFLPFFTTKPIGVGTGLGLSISYGIIKDLGGRLYFDRSFGDSRFVIELSESKAEHSTKLPTSA